MFSKMRRNHFHCVTYVFVFYVNIASRYATCYTYRVKYVPLEANNIKQSLEIA